VTLVLDDTVRLWIAERGYDRSSAPARLPASSSRTSKTPLADEILFGKLEKGAR